MAGRSDGDWSRHSSRSREYNHNDRNSSRDSYSGGRRRRNDESEYDRRRQRERGRRDSFDERDERDRRRRDDDRGYDDRRSYDNYSDRNGGGSKQQRSGQEPTASIIIRGLSERTTEPMGTGLSRCFAFAEFGGVEGSQAVMNAYGGSAGFSGPWLTIDGNSVNMEYTVGDRNNWQNGPSAGPRGGPRADWVCPYCETMNFARRAACFKCNQKKDEQAIPCAGNPDEPTATGVPGPVLLCRGLSTRTTEEAVHEIFRAFAPLKEVRLVRDVVTNASRGFCFVEFNSTEHATHTLNAAASTDLRIEHQRVTLAYAKDAMRRGHSGPISLGARKLANAALSQAQWGLGNNYSSDQRSASSAAALAAQVDNMRASKKAEAAIRAAQQVRARAWPPSFEEDGAAWTFDASSGYYYEQSSAFYYDVRAKLYYKSATGQYFRHTPATRPPYSLFTPPPMPPVGATAAAPAVPVPLGAVPSAAVPGSMDVGKGGKGGKGDPATNFLQAVIPSPAPTVAQGSGGWQAKRTAEVEAKARAEAQMAAFSNSNSKAKKTSSSSSGRGRGSTISTSTTTAGGRGGQGRGRGGQGMRGGMRGGRGGQAAGRGRGGGGRGGAVASAVAGAVAGAVAAGAGAGAEKTISAAAAVAAAAPPPPPAAAAAVAAAAAPAPAPTPVAAQATLDDLGKTYASTQASILFNGRPVVLKKDGKWVCMLCRRKFAQEDLLRKHVESSPLHAENFAKLKAKLSVKPQKLGSITGAVVGPGTGIVYRNRAQERRALHGQADQIQTLGLSRNEKEELLVKQQEQRQAEVESDATQREGANKINEPIKGDNIGNQIMQKLGWTGGGLGKDQSGIVEPVKAQGTLGKSGVGAESGSGFDSSKVIGANFRDAQKKMARARYEAEFEQGGGAEKRARTS